MLDPEENVVIEPRQAISAVKFATGNMLTSTVLAIVSWQPSVFITISVTVKVPGPEKKCIGFFAYEILPGPVSGSPKFQFQLIIAPPPFSCEKSWN